MIVLDKNFDAERVFIRISRKSEKYTEYDLPDVVRIEVITK